MRKISLDWYGSTGKIDSLLIARRPPTRVYIRRPGSREPLMRAWVLVLCFVRCRRNKARFRCRRCDALSTSDNSTQIYYIMFSFVNSAQEKRTKGNVSFYACLHNCVVSIRQDGNLCGVDPMAPITYREAPFRSGFFVKLCNSHELRLFVSIAKTNKLRDKQNSWCNVTTNISTNTRKNITV